MKRRKEAKLDIRVEQEFLDTCRKEAEKRGMKLAPWVRMACLQAIGKTGNENAVGTRDLFAARAMSVLWARPPLAFDPGAPEVLFEQIAELAYRFADIMLAARDRKK